MSRQKTITLEGFTKRLNKDGFTASVKSGGASLPKYIHIDMEKLGVWGAVRFKPNDFASYEIEITMHGRRQLKEDRAEIEKMITKQIRTSLNAAMVDMGIMA